MRARTLDEIRALFLADRYAVEVTRISIDAVDPMPPPEAVNACVGATCSLEVEPMHRNAGGAVQGGALYTLADFCFAVGANAYQDDAITVTTSSTIQYLGVCKGHKLIATLHPRHAGRSMVFAQIDIHDDLGNLVATVLSESFTKHLRKPSFGVAPDKA